MERLSRLRAPAPRAPGDLPLLRPLRRAVRRAAPLLCALLGCVLLALPARADAPQKFAGTYRIQDWRALQARGLYHFFYLAPDGHFLLAAEWPGKERSQFAGTWDAQDGTISLDGQGHVETNEGSWSTTFHRTYQLQMEGAGFVLAPEPQKNRYGLMGWPQYYRFYRRAPAPNLPGVPLPGDEAAMARHIAELLAGKP
jgi:hypothetical protein